MKTVTKTIQKKFLEYLTERIQNLDYSDIDCFLEDYELSEEECEKWMEDLTALMQHISIKVNKIR